MRAPRLFEREAAAAAVFAALALLLFLSSYKRHYLGALSFEAAHYAELATNLLEGRGFVTRTFWPCELAVLKSAGAEAHPFGPVVQRQPLAALWSAFWMALAGRGDFGLALGTGVAHALWAGLLYLLGRRLFDQRTALFAAGLWAAHPVMVAGFDLLGYPDVLFGLLFTALNFLWWEESGAKGRAGPRAAALGLLAGACSMTRSSFALWLPLFLLLPRLRGRVGPWRAAGLFLAGYAAGVLPGAAYHLRHLGTASPPVLLWNLAQGTVAPGLPWMEYRVYGVSDFLSAEAALRLARKGWGLFNELLSELPNLWRQPLAFPCAALGLLGASGAAASFGGWCAALFGWQALAFSFLRYEHLGFTGGRYYLWAAPLFLLYAVSFFAAGGPSKARKAAGLACLLLLLQFWAGAYASFPRASDHPSGRPVSAWPELAWLKERAAAGERVVTNLPAQTAWYTGLWTMNVPNRPEELGALLADWPAEWLFIEAHRLGELDNLPAWKELFASGRAPGFLAEHGFRPAQGFPSAAVFRREPPDGGLSSPSPSPAD